LEQYRQNVQRLCEKLGVPNPIPEEVLTIEALIFGDVPGFDGVFRVEATDMNRAGRLFYQHILAGNGATTTRPIVWFTLNPIILQQAQNFFTSELWDDCGPDKRTLVFGTKMGKHVKPIYKE
jgi:hypothetical protein